jgi:hypothetical protein
MTAFARYSGLVRMREAAWLNGLRLSPGDVVPVENLTLWADDPFEPVEVVGQVRNEETTLPRGHQAESWSRFLFGKVKTSIYPVSLRAEYLFSLGNQKLA